MEHSKLPWKYVEYGTYGRKIEDADEKMITNLNAFDNDVAYIIEAANNYPKLQDMLKELVAEMDQLTKYTIENNSDLLNGRHVNPFRNEYIQNLKSVIAKSKELIK